MPRSFLQEPACRPRARTALRALAAVWVLAALALGARAGQPDKGPAAGLKLGRQVAMLCLHGSAEPLVQRFNAAMRGAVTRDQLQAVLDGTVNAARAGRRLSEAVGGRADAPTYEAVYDWNTYRLRIQAVFDREGKIGGLLLNVLREATPPADPRAGYRLHQPLRLPCDGEWWVFWGGDALQQNYHVSSQDQRHAYDLVKRSEGVTHRAGGSRNEEYYCWGEPVLAPAAGRVVAVVNTVADNVPGVMNTAAVFGNHVVIEMSRGEFAVLCHFQQGSIQVKPGSKVTAGQRLGRCGNSGNSSEPHIHLHVQDRQRLGPAALGLPAPFSHYEADGKPVKSGVPVRGQTVRNQAAR